MRYVVAQTVDSVGPAALIDREKQGEVGKVKECDGRMHVCMYAQKKTERASDQSTQRRDPTRTPLPAATVTTPRTVANPPSASIQPTRTPNTACPHRHTHGHHAP